MKYVLIVFFAGFFAQSFAQSTSLYNDNVINTVRVTLPADSLQFILTHIYSNTYFHADFVYDDGASSDTLLNIGFRLRGNTSRNAAKKSFKISFNQFQTGRAYQGAKSLNLNSEHNDPTMVREKLFYDIWKRAGMPPRRTSFAKLYINGLYFGIYTNIEEIDKSWVQRAYSNNGGNIYKCTYPADLNYVSNDPNYYKSLGGANRVYDLQTNTVADDYTDLANLIAALNTPINAQNDSLFLQKIDTILNVETVLKAFAIDVATGNWDDYFYNKNNFFLYKNTATRRFEMITYDTDNTLGIDWINKDWATRSCNSWLPSSAAEKRPLIKRLLAVPAYNQRYKVLLDSITRYVTAPAVIFPRIDSLKSLLQPLVAADSFRTLDYNYTVANFINGFTATVPGHTPYGIKPFLDTRYVNSLLQIGVLDTQNNPQKTPLLFVAPNPANSYITLKNYRKTAKNGSINDILGRERAVFSIDNTAPEIIINISMLEKGIYFFKLDTGEVAKFLKE